jgi:hypothetical protein
LEFGAYSIAIFTTAGALHQRLDTTGFIRVVLQFLKLDRATEYARDTTGFSRVGTSISNYMSKAGI